MYAFFRGTVDDIQADKAVIEVNGVGYEINMPESELITLDIGDIVKIYTYLAVREDDMRLFGFKTKGNLEFFKKLITVSGVGPKVALGIISNVDTETLGIAIATENVEALRSVPGIGPKMAQKIIFELKDKVLKEAPDKAKIKVKEVNNKNIEEATTALEVLGYTSKQIKEAMSNMNLENDSVETIIRKVLKEVQNY
ncbi:MAG: Holliday junction branch migration protein RuvA [Clostridia bacterium]|jgi:Holliday junction DNA helicase RuvA|nr:Holliday junction branch migration protein RuvA [Clostridia bacterium]